MLAQAQHHAAELEYSHGTQQHHHGTELKSSHGAQPQQRTTTTAHNCLPRVLGQYSYPIQNTASKTQVNGGLACTAQNCLPAVVKWTLCQRCRLHVWYPLPHTYTTAGRQLGYHVSGDISLYCGGTCEGQKTAENRPYAAYQPCSNIEPRCPGAPRVCVRLLAAAGPRHVCGTCGRNNCERTLLHCPALPPLDQTLPDARAAQPPPRLPSQLRWLMELAWSAAAHPRGNGTRKGNCPLSVGYTCLTELGRDSAGHAGAWQSSQELA